MQFIRGAWIDGVFFAAAVLALALDSLGVLPAVVARSGVLRARTIAIAVVALAVVLALAPRHGPVVGATVAAIGIAALALAWTTRPQGTEGWAPPAVRAAFAWAILGVGTCLWELAMYLLGSFAPGGRTAYPALSDLLDPLVTGPVGQGVFAAIWLRLGVVLLRGILVRERGR